MMEALKAIYAATRRLLKEWRVMAVMAAAYASLLAALLMFIATKEATRWQVTLTLLFAALAPALFFLLQAMMVNYAHGEARIVTLLRRSFKDSCKLALASIPFALLVVLSLYIVNKLYTYSAFQIPFPSFPQETWPPVHSRSSNFSSTPLLSWSQLSFSTLRFLTFAIILPLAAIHLWGATIREGLFKAIKGFPRNLARAFAPETALTYTVGLVLFGLIPYLLLFTHTHASNTWVEFTLFVARLLLVFIFTLYGWALTIAALAGNAKGVGEV
jgi:hypothetical protein